MKTFEDIARDFLESVTSELDTYTSIKGKIYGDGNSMILETPDHIQYAFAGRGPGKKPPLEAMLELVRSKNIIFDGADERGTAFALQAIIAKKGTKNHKPNAPDILESTVNKYQEIYKNELGEVLLVEIDNRLKREMEEMWREQGRLFKNFKI
tara:strand:+ start:945 stop:1403 length:459 start_codon:yes stop_codon:yes gene_type:complete